MTRFPGVKALTFDLFGTVVDWRGSIVREGERLSASYGFHIDWHAVAVRWAEKYVEARNQGGPWRPLEEILRQAGRELIGEFHIDGLSGPDHERWINTWSRLDPWSDVVPGLTALRAHHRIAPLSNANADLAQAIADHGGLPWHLVLGPDVVQAYKPDPRMYCWALRQLQLDGPEVMMVAAHLYDLKGAKALGFRTAFVHRDDEEEDDPKKPYVDLIAKDFVDLAEQLAS